MSLLNRRSTTIPATGVGRKDYSQKIEYSVEREIRSLQERFFYSYRFDGLSELTFPDVYESPLQFLVNGALQYTAPSTKPWMFYLVNVTTDRNALCVVTLNRYASYTDYLAGTIAENLGTAFGYGEAKLELTKGIVTEAGSVYSVQYGDFCAGDFNMDIIIHGLIGGYESLE